MGAIEGTNQILRLGVGEKSASAGARSEADGARRLCRIVRRRAAKKLRLKYQVAPQATARTHLRAGSDAAGIIVDRGAPDRRAGPHSAAGRHETAGGREALRWQSPLFLVLTCFCFFHSSADRDKKK